MLEQRAQVQAMANALAHLLALQAVQAMAQAAAPGGVDLVAQHT